MSTFNAKIKKNNSNKKAQSFSKPKAYVIICYEKLETLTLEPKLMPNCLMLPSFKMKKAVMD